METDGRVDTKTRERTESAAKAVQAMHGDSCISNRVDPDPMCSTGFGVKVEPPALPWRDDVVVENGAASLKYCLEELDGQDLRGALDGKRDLELRGCPVYWTSSIHPSSSATVWYANFKRGCSSTNIRF